MTKAQLEATLLETTLDYYSLFAQFQYHHAETIRFLEVVEDEGALYGYQELLNHARALYKHLK